MFFYGRCRSQCVVNYMKSILTHNSYTACKCEFHPNINCRVWAGCHCFLFLLRYFLTAEYNITFIAFANPHRLAVGDTHSTRIFRGEGTGDTTYTSARRSRIHLQDISTGQSSRGLTFCVTCVGFQDGC